MRILLAEDETALCDRSSAFLGLEGRVVDVVHDGEEAAFLGATEPYDLVILDIGLPKRDGISVLKDWRRNNVSVPVLLLTARDSWSDRVDGLDAGADDYLTKHFHMPELSARVRAMLRRKTGLTNPLFERGALFFRHPARRCGDGPRHARGTDRARACCPDISCASRRSPRVADRVVRAHL